MYGILYKYLILNNKIGFPGIGSFFIEAVPAKMDIVTSTLVAPGNFVNFKADEVISDNRFYEYLSKEMRTSEIEAATQFTRFSHELKDYAMNDGVVLPGLGTLKKSYEGSLSFYAETPANTLLPEIKINNSVAVNANLIDVYDSGETKIITQEGIAPLEEKIVKEDNEDYWWVWAIILALCGLGALLYYYI